MVVRRHRNSLAYQASIASRGRAAPGTLRRARSKNAKSPTVVSMYCILKRNSRTLIELDERQGSGVVRVALRRCLSGISI